MEPTQPIDTRPPLEQFSSRKLYDVYRVSIRMRNKLVGGKPKNPDMLKDWIVSTTKFDDGLTEEQVAFAKQCTLDETIEKSWTGFYSDERGLFIPTRHINSMLRQCASVLGMFSKKIGTKQIVREGGAVKGLEVEDQIYFDRTKPDDFDEGPIHVTGPKGNRSAIKRSDYVKQVTLTFEIWLLKTAPQEDRHVGEKELITILTFAQENGLGACRSQQYGKFDVVEFEKISEGIQMFKSIKKEPKGKEAKAA